MPLIYALAPTLLLTGLALTALALLARRLSGEGAARAAFGRIGRMAMTLAVIGALPIAAVAVQTGALPSQQALADLTFTVMSSSIVR